MANFYGQSLVPAGTSSSMDADHRPLVPLYDDATPAFREGIRAIERAAREDVQLTIAPRVPPPGGLTADAVLNGDRQLVWDWYGTLDLPKPKTWWRNWRDVLPWPFSSR